MSRNSRSSASKSDILVDKKEDLIVEKILLRLQTDPDKTEYYVKWKGCPESKNTWEPAENLKNCGDLIKKFEEDSLKNEGIEGRKRKLETDIDLKSYSSKKVKEDENSNPDDSEQNLEPERIIDRFQDANGDIVFEMKWKGCSKTDVLSADLVIKKYIVEVTKFYGELLSSYDSTSITIDEKRGKDNSKKDIKDNANRESKDNSKKDSMDNTKRESRGNSKKDSMDNTKRGSRSNFKKDGKDNAKKR